MSSSNQTANFGLSQYAGSDAFSRDDFNADNVTIDNALKSLSDTTAQYQYVLGSYVGNGDTSGKRLTLGFKPKLVMIFTDSQQGGYSMFLIQGLTYTDISYRHVGGYTQAVTWYDDGVGWGPHPTYNTNPTTTADMMNVNGSTYIYIAFK